MPKGLNLFKASRPDRVVVLHRKISKSEKLLIGRQKYHQVSGTNPAKLHRLTECTEMPKSQAASKALALQQTVATR